ncbi:FGGY family carbohydrate kinase [Piscinibacter sakaiensis]|uniref:ATP:glycerol 3-phosphotransferase n=1 Tax=Piscinibacter sakaiensis TaxID=1547922 RepID=A0A0K8P894_PISS1|nr:FGGY family carbohydrate kinase [Piscinibacter sakaiensis]GAP38857.1 glycerol kinase [Piscinibacter sakaiensis]
MTSPPATDPVLVIDCGTTRLKLSLVAPDGTVLVRQASEVPVQRDAEGLAWDGAVLGRCVLDGAAALLAGRRVAGVAIANQRVSCLLWDAATGAPLGPVLGWSDRRTRGLDRALRAQGLRHTPGLTGSKLRWLLDQADPERRRSRAGGLRAGTLDSWLLWLLSGGRLHLSDHVNAAQTGLFDVRRLAWDEALAEALGVPPRILPQPVPNTGPYGPARALPGAPPLLAVIGDQQASLVGQGALAPGACKITFGTVGVVNAVLGDAPLAAHSRDAFGNIACSTPAGVLHGAESSMQSAGSAIEWLMRAGVLDEAAALDCLVDPCRRSGAVFVSALEGLGAPHWKPAARAAFLGLDASDGRAELCRAVLDGIACAAAEILDRLEAVVGRPLGEIGLDGGLSASRAFQDILAATTGRPLRRAGSTEATTRGAAALAFAALQGLPPDRALPPPPGAGRVQPRDGTRPADRAAWAHAVQQVLATAAAPAAPATPLP